MPLPDLPRADTYLTHYAETAPDALAWIDGDRIYNYKDASAAVDALAGSLLSLGVRPGQRVAVYGKPSADFMALFLAITSIGAVYVGLNPKYTVHELGVVIDDCEPVLLLQLLEAVTEHTEKIDLLLSTRARLRQLGISQLSTPSQNADDFSQVLKDVRASIKPQDVALLVYTSGSTGTPKGAQLTHRGITFVGHIVNDPAHFGVQGHGRSLCNLPINHVGCVVDTCTNSLMAGATLIFQGDFDPEAMLSAVEKHRLTLLGGVPVMFLAMSQSPKFLTTDYSSLQKVVLAGNPPPLPLVQLLKSVMKCTVLNGYGLTEAMGFSTFTQEDDPPEVVAGTVGKFDPRVEWRLDNGEIQMRGDWLFAGYFRNPTATAEAFTQDGWFRTGDLAELTDGENIRLVGRSKEVFKSGGYNVYPLEIEQALESIEGVAMAVVVPVPDEVYVEVGYAFVVAPQLSEEALKNQLRTRLANYKVPKTLELVSTLPVLPIGKVDRIQLKNLARSKYAQATAGMGKR